MNVGDILRAAADNNVTVNTGSNTDVGIAGWTAGGGHGAVSSRYGLGADQVVEMEVVTAQGEILTVNKDSSPDLFWALRGVSWNIPVTATAKHVREADQLLV